MEVATALTACGIETSKRILYCNKTWSLQQHLPLAVLKRINHDDFPPCYKVATALTACGIETNTPLKTCSALKVATALTACGIETIILSSVRRYVTQLQQHLPLAVLKLIRR